MRDIIIGLVVLGGLCGALITAVLPVAREIMKEEKE